MSQSVAELQRLIRYTLSGDAPTEVPELQIINEAGEHLIGMRTWNFLARPELLLPLTASQAWIVLPADFGSVVSLEFADSLNGSLVKSTGANVSKLSSPPLVEGPLTFFWWLPYEGSAALGAPEPRIYLHQAPSTNEVDAVRLIYRAGWTKLSGDGDIAVVPSWCETLLRQLVVAFARGYVEEDVMTLDERLEKIKNGSIFSGCARRDGLVRTNLGQMQGGAAEMAERAHLWNPDVTVGPPVSY